MMDTSHSVIIIAAAALITLLTRLTPFLLFGKGRMPEKLARPAAALPPAIIAVLVIYCLRADLFTLSPSAAASALGCAAVAAAHLLKRNTLLSISVGTAVYMLCIRIIPGAM